MRTFSMAGAAVLAAALAASGPCAAAEEEWTEVNDADQLRTLLEGKAMDGNYWVFYFRQDGKMAYLQDDYETVREWRVTEEGALCFNVYGMPDRIIECPEIQRSATDPDRYRIKNKNGVHDFKIAEPPKRAMDLIEAKTAAE